ncbi:YchJ family protein [Vibrio plantisponsor]|uniref:YchJ family protein n=1 Tax=Vibrio plantisponsor TaxID=664643 RepID=A0ABU4IEP4_9VIBR|nr:YchJ family protein [Vibrio plantisponsor]MDW6016624.1 YchJ family protein [Vibrio plantisponsor]NNM40005.1 YchJ family protein [Vibrio plantisponsor]
MTSCYCGNTQSYSECCQPIHNDHHKAKTPEQLMRARYSAHVVGLVDFIVSTYHPSCNAETDREAIADSVNSNWKRLQVIKSDNGSTENEGYVHFKAFIEEQGKELCLEERSRFVKEDGLWFYIDGEFPQHNQTLKLGRNDPCICGSGKKYKKCCG